MTTPGSTCLQIAALVAACIVLAPTPAGAWNGGGHYWAAEAAAQVFGAGGGPTASKGPLMLFHPCMLPGETRYRLWDMHDQMVPDYPDICRETRYGIPILPELGFAKWQWHFAGEDWIFAPYPEWTVVEDRYLWDWLREGAQREDDRTLTTAHHFWFSEEGLYECPNDTLVEENAWETVEVLWVHAIDFWFEGNLGAAYTTLGYVMHLVQDMGQPAHSNEDMHPGDALSDDDSLEDWMTGTYCQDGYLAGRDLPSSFDLLPGWVFPPPLLHEIGNPPANVPSHWLSDGEIVGSLIKWEYSDEVMADPYFTDPWLIQHYEMPQLFEIMYMMNQIGGYFASDDEDGNTEEPLGWLYNYDEEWYGFPKGGWLFDNEGGQYVEAQKSSGLGGSGMLDNDACDCDRDGDLSVRIFPWTYGAAFNASKFVLDLFRKTVDRVPPTSRYFIIVADSHVAHGTWHNGKATVSINGADDHANTPGFRPSGVWKVWGLVDGAWASRSDPLLWTFETEGDHLVQLMSTDLMGNVEQTDLHVKLDFTAPSIHTPGMQPSFDSCRQADLTIAWTAEDFLSGVATSSARLDGESVSNGQVKSLRTLGTGSHSLSVHAEDQAGNEVTVEYPFQVTCMGSCGNGVLDAGEACDDHNVIDGDGCDSNCTVTACGNQITTQATGERCDGTPNCTAGCACASGYTPDWQGFCLPVVCGNRWQEDTEECDDANSSDGDGCSSTCQVESGFTCEFFVAHDFCKTTCGDGVVAGKETCDDGNQTDGDGCDSDCTMSSCGNGIVAGAEVCDDANALDGDGCDSNCTETACGNGIQAANEACDDGNLFDGDGCDSNCSVTACGNGIVTGDEACDDGNLTSGDGCDWDCSPTACGADPDNDTRWTATPFGACGQTSAAIDCDGDVDYYAFTAPSTSNYSFSTTPAGLAVVWLYDAGGNALDRRLTSVARRVAAGERLLVRTTAADPGSSFYYNLEIATRGTLRRVIPPGHPGGGS